MTEPVYIIGEIGINHNGDIDITKRLIDIAACAGFNAVKFQKRDPDVCVPESQKHVIRKTPWGDMTYLEYKKKVEFGEYEYDIISDYCTARNIEWSASPWDLNSAKFLTKYNLPWVKIASASLVDLELIWFCAITFDKLILSTGMSTYQQVVDAVTCCKRYMPVENITLLHCNSSYPTPVTEINLNVIESYKNDPVFNGIKIGYSGHEYGIVSTIATVAMGATCIERHITLDKGMWGSDHACSLEPHAMFKLTRGVRELELAMGTHNKHVTTSEKGKIKTLRGDIK